MRTRSRMPAHRFMLERERERGGGGGGVRRKREGERLGWLLA